VDTLRYETALIQATFKILLTIAGIMIYAYPMGYRFIDVFNTVFVDTASVAVQLRTALCTYFVAANIAYFLMQLAGRIGVVRACVYPNIVAPFLTYAIIRFRRSESGPEGLQNFFDTLLSPLLYDARTGETWEFQNLTILLLACVSCWILSWEGMSQETEDQHHFEKSLWSRAEGPSLFTNLNFLLNRQRLSPKTQKTKRRGPSEDYIIYGHMLL